MREAFLITASGPLFFDRQEFGWDRRGFRGRFRMAPENIGTPEEWEPCPLVIPFPNSRPLVFWVTVTGSEEGWLTLAETSARPT